MSITDFLSKIFGATERIEAALVGETAARAELATANARIVELEAAASAGPVSDSARVTELEGLLETAEASLATANASNATLTASQTDFDARVTTAANAEAARIVAAAGHDPVITAIKPDGEKKPESGLKGTAAVAAMIKSKRESKKA